MKITRVVLTSSPHPSQFTVLVGAEWAGAPNVLRGAVLAAARAVAPAGPASPACPASPADLAAPDLAEALFSVLVALTKKLPRVVDWIDDLLPDLVDLGMTLNSLEVYRYIQFCIKGTLEVRVTRRVNG